jgi:hypothetical protein
MIFFYKKLINGEIGLKRAFWLYGNIYPFFISLFIILTIVVLQEDIKISIFSQKFMDISYIGKVLIIFEGLIFFIYTSFATIGVWKSANNYEGKKIWAYFSKFLIIYAYYSYIQNALFLIKN